MLEFAMQYRIWRNSTRVSRYGSSSRRHLGNKYLKVFFLKFVDENP